MQIRLNIFPEKQMAGIYEELRTVLFPGALASEVRNSFVLSEAICRIEPDMEKLRSYISEPNPDGVEAKNITIRKDCYDRISELARQENMSISSAFRAYILYARDELIGNRPNKESALSAIELHNLKIELDVIKNQLEKVIAKIEVLQDAAENQYD